MTDGDKGPGPGPRPLDYEPDVPDVPFADIESSSFGWKDAAVIAFWMGGFVAFGLLLLISRNW